MNIKILLTSNAILCAALVLISALLAYKSLTQKVEYKISPEGRLIYVRVSVRDFKAILDGRWNYTVFHRDMRTNIVYEQIP